MTLAARRAVSAYAPWLLQLAFAQAQWGTRLWTSGLQGLGLRGPAALSHSRGPRQAGQWVVRLCISGYVSLSTPSILLAPLSPLTPVLWAFFLFPASLFPFPLWRHPALLYHVLGFRFSTDLSLSAWCVGIRRYCWRRCLFAPEAMSPSSLATPTLRGSARQRALARLHRSALAPLLPPLLAAALVTVRYFCKRWQDWRWLSVYRWK